MEDLISEHQLKLPPTERERFRALVEIAKRELSQQEESQFHWQDAQLTLSRTRFEELSEPFNLRIKNVLNRCLRDAQLTSEDLDDVLLVGGASRMNSIQHMLSVHLGKFPSRSLDPDRVVAMGAAIQAALCDKSEGVQDVVLTDVCPHTLGTDISREVAPNHFRDGFFEPLIERNTVVPVSKVKRYNTLTPLQDVVQLRIFQGEHRRVEKNTQLGELKIDGLKHRPGTKHGGEIDVRFSYDMNGILEVDVTNVATQQTFSKIIEERPGSLSEKNIEEAKRRLAPLKIHPRDLLENRAILERSARLYQELMGPNRDHLDQLTLQFEAALGSQNTMDINMARSLLEQFTEPYFRIEDRPSTPKP